MTGIRELKDARNHESTSAMSICLWWNDRKLLVHVLRYAWLTESVPQAVVKDQRVKVCAQEGLLLGGGAQHNDPPVGHWHHRQDGCDRSPIVRRSRDPAEPKKCGLSRG